MSTSQVQLSLIVPAHNEEKYIEATLVALFAAAESIGMDYEVIVVNDDSSDSTAAIAARLGAHVENVKLRNIGAVRNAGAKVASGRWFVFVDADTIVPESTLQAAIAALKDGAIGGGAKVDLDDLPSLPWSKRMLYHTIVFVWQKVGRWAAGCFMFCDSDAFRKFGGFNEVYFAGEEYFFSKQLKRLGPFLLIKEPVITSARKLHGYSAIQLGRMLIRPMFTLKGFFKSKTGLEILYEDKR